MRLTIEQVLSATGGSYLVRPLNESDMLSSITWDSRLVEADGIFLALAGERVDGHDYAAGAIDKGAKCLLLTHALSDEVVKKAKEQGVALIEVENSQKALSDLAQYWRSQLSADVIAVTGSTGKTTTKNLIKDVLSSTYRTVATKANQNNELGVPATLLSAEEDTDFLVVEMGMRGRGQISELVDAYHPDAGLIINVGESHIELLGSRDNIARAKAEIFKDLPAERGVAFLNAACDYCQFCEEEACLEERGIKRVYFDGSLGRDNSFKDKIDHGFACVWAEQLELDDAGCASFILKSSGFADSSTQTDEQEVVFCHLGISGMHVVIDALAAAAVGRYAHISLSSIALALACALPESGRQQVITSAAGYKVIHDAYNANPDSMKASIRALSAMKTSGRRIAILGDMGELGDYSITAHKDLGTFVASSDIDYLIGIGKFSYEMVQAALQAGMREENVYYAREFSEVMAKLVPNLTESDIVLVKASHFMELERVVEGLVG